MKRKIFISINLPEKAKKSLAKATQKWQDLPVKWIREQNLHLTLQFLGYVNDEAIEQMCQKAKEAIKKQESFEIEFNRIETGPNEKDQKLIWVTGEPNEDLKNLTEALEKELGTFVSEKKSFRPHITLGRIRKNKWEALVDKPDISEKFNFSVYAESVDVMASDFENEGMEYTLIESCPLK